jgi:uncharacterized membrane protein YdfJ with MMPL/SSD domain
MSRRSEGRHDVNGSQERDPVGTSDDPLAGMRGCLLGVVAASGLWVLGGLLALGVIKLGVLATAALALAAIIGAGLVAGAVLAWRRLRGSSGQRRLDSGPAEPTTDRNHADETRAVRQPNDS